jgi:hypothetical protein
MFQVKTMKNKLLRLGNNIDMNLKNEDIYYTVNSIGEIEINPNQRVFLTYLFKQVGIDIDTIKTPDEFEKPYLLAKPFQEEALMHAVTLHGNKYYIKAFEFLIFGDGSEFSESAQRGHNYAELKRNMLGKKT